MMAIFEIPILMLLIRANRYYDPIVCASLWGAETFFSGLFSVKKFMPNLLTSLLAFGVAWAMFKILKTTDAFSMKWLAVAGIGGFVLIFVL